MFDNLGWAEILGLLLVALFILGPERLPNAIRDLLRGVRKLRQMARNATTDLSRELGTNVQLEDLHPKTFLRKHILSEEDEAMLRRPLESVYKDVQEVAKETDLSSVSGSSTSSSAAAEPEPSPNGRKPTKFDMDAT